MKYIAIVLLLTVSQLSFAEELKTVDDTKNKCSKAAIKFGEGNIKESFNLLAPYWPIPKQEINNLIYQTETQLKTVETRFGSILGSDFTRTETAGDSFAKHTYVIKFEKHAIRYICVFYKPKTEWLVNTVKWDDSIELLF